MNGLYLSFDTDPRPERIHDAFPEPTLDAPARAQGEVRP